jgi:hypothetical protein
VDADNAAYSSLDGVLFDKARTTLIQFPGGRGGGYAIPNTVTTIEESAFQGCSTLTTVTIPNSVTTIEYSAFLNCTSLTSATIPNSVTGIWWQAFYNCTSVTNFSVDAANAVYSSLDGVLFNKAQTTLIQFPGGRGGSYVIPNSVTTIGESAFSYCTSLTSVTIPDSVTTFEDQAFYNCTSLTNVVIGNGVSSIGYQAFTDCTSLTSVMIPSSVTSIGGMAFYNCTSLTSVTIPNSVASIWEFAFYNCTSLTSVTIPNSVTIIGWDVFSYCYSLTNFSVDAANAVYSSLGGVLFDKAQTTLIQFPGGRGGSYTLPNSVTSIGAYAFYDCTSLTGVYFQGNAPTVGGNVFSGATNVTVYYLPATTGWETTFAGRPAVLWNPLVQTDDASFGVRTNQFGFNITWASGMVVVVEASTNLANPAWIPVGTNTLTSGASYFSDPEWTNHPARFYRLRSP